MDIIKKVLMCSSFFGIFINIIILCTAELKTHELPLIWLLNVSDLCLILEKIDNSKKPCRIILFVLLAIAHLFFIPICIMDQSSAGLVIWFLLHLINYVANFIFALPSFGIK